MIGNRAVALTLRLMRLQFAIVNLRAKYYLKCFSNTRVACSILIWTKITGGKPLDFDSRLYTTIAQVVEYYLCRSFADRLNPTIFENLILRYEFALGRNVPSAAEKQRLFRFVLKHRIPIFLKQYENIGKFIAYGACAEIEKADARWAKPPSAAAHWLALVNSEMLREYFGSNSRRFLLHRLRRHTRQLKKAIRQHNLLKIDFAASDLSSLVALSGTMLLLLGYLRIVALCWYFGIPYERYFTVTDYLSSSISSVQTYLISAAATVGFWWLFGMAAENSYSLQEGKWHSQSFSGRMERWAIRFTLLTCAVGLALLCYQGEYTAAIPAAYFVAMYASFQLLARLARTFFSNPLKFYLYAGLVSMSILGGLSGTAREIADILAPSVTAPGRTLRFESTEYTEPSWRVLAITSGFAILRRQMDGTIHVLNRSDLKSVVSTQMKN